LNNFADLEEAKSFVKLEKAFNATKSPR
jgi:hypothetical protein